MALRKSLRLRCKMMPILRQRSFSLGVLYTQQGKDPEGGQHFFDRQSIMIRIMYKLM